MIGSRKQSNFRLRQQSSRATKTNCEICQNKFQMLVNQQHQCKRCWRVICINCVSSRIKVFQLDGTSVIHKICKICQKDQDMINSLIQDNNLIFLMSSKLSEEWMKKINKEKLNFQDIINQYEEMKFQSNSNTIKFKSQNKKICEELFSTYHYSMRQFIGKMTQQIRNQTIYQSVSNVMLALFGYLKELPYVPELIYFVVYMLCFCSEFQCYFIISRFIQKIYPQYLRLENMKRFNLLSQQSKMLVEMYKLLAKSIDKQQLIVIVSFLQNKFLSFIKSFTVNITNVSITYFLIDQMLKNSSYIDLYKGVAATIYCSREIIQEGRDNSTIDGYMLSEISLQQIKNSFIVFEKSNMKFEMDHQLFDSAQHSKLHQKYKQLESLYTKSDEKCKNLETKYKSLAKQYEQVVSQLNESNKKIASLQEEIINLADKMFLVQEAEHYKQENQALIKKNTYASETIKLLEQKLQEATKKYQMEQISRKMYIKLQKDYQNEIVELKTKNQVYQIEKLANDINFSTSFIDYKFQQKNKQILELQRQNKNFKDEIEFYKSQKPGQYLSKASFAYANGRNEKLFNNNLSFIPTKGQESKRNYNSLNFSTFMNSSKQQKDSFKKLLQANKQLIQKLKNDIKNFQNKNQLLENEVTKMKQIIQSQKNQIAVSLEINWLMKQVPQEINYIKNISDFEKIISKEQNLHKKAQLQFILSSFRKCLLEARYRAIDSKIKQNKIRELTGLPIITSSYSSNTLEQSFYQNLNDDGQDITAKLSWICDQEQVSKINKLIIKQQTCNLM